MVEFFIIVFPLILISLGVLEFGYVLMKVNIVTHAARDGGRMAAVTPISNRDGNGIIQDTTSIEDRVRDQMKNVMSAADVAAMTVEVTQPTVDGIPMVSVRVAGPVALIYGGMPSPFGASGFAMFAAPALNFDRTVTFRDEGR
jgi:hypothetical protein